jgi:hypothetical protein
MNQRREIKVPSPEHFLMQPYHLTYLIRLTHLTSLQSALPLDDTTISMVQSRGPQLAVEICVAPNAVVRTIK